MNRPVDSIARRARALFVRRCADLDADTVARLRQARSRAQATNSPPRAITRTLLPAGAMAVCVLALVAVWDHQPAVDATPTVAPAVAAQATDGAPPDAADVALYSDLDFYQWLAAQPALAKYRN